MGEIQYGIQEVEKKSLRFKRSLYIVKDIKVGERFTNENLRVIRPGDGLAPKYYDKFIGKTAKKDFQAGTPLNWDTL